MENIKMLKNGMYLPNNPITNEQIEKRFQVENNYIYQRTGIKKRYFVADETIEQMAYKAASNVLKKANINANEIDLIVVATTSTNRLMPGISYFVQKQLQIKKCICFDILAGCSGYINAFDIARNYLALGKIKKALVIGVDLLSNCTDPKDINTAIILSDGAGATILERTEEKKQYGSCIQSDGSKGDLLTLYANEMIQMNGKEIYKYAVTQTVENILTLLKENHETLDNIKYIVPHQSNSRIMKAIANRLDVPMQKVYCNIEQVGNTFCASIPIALTQLQDNNRIQKKDKIILLGYGGGLNTGSILMEV